MTTIGVGSMTLRVEVQKFTRSCEKLARVAQTANGLTDEEREVIQAIPPINGWRPSSSNVTCIINPQPAQLTLTKANEGGHSSVRQLGNDGRLTRLDSTVKNDSLFAFLCPLLLLPDLLDLALNVVPARVFPSIVLAVLSDS